jgi:hypothetical protein
VLSCDTFTEAPIVMTAKTCRDCGNVLELQARGCPRCALNFEAENMIDRFFWRRFVPGLLLLFFTVTALAYLLVAVSR